MIEPNLDVGASSPDVLGVFRMRLQVFMLERKWTIKAMASYIEVHPNTLTAWLDPKSKRSPQTAKVVKVGKRLGLSLDELIR